jgi:nicotinamidase-related amidase
MDVSQAVLIPIDVQQGFDLPPWGRRSNPDMESAGQRLLAGFRAAGRPVLHIRHDSVTPGSPLLPGQPGNDFRPGFDPLPGEPVISKSVNSALIGTDLDLRLRRLGARTLVLFGISTDMCVSTTARMAANLGYTVILAADACCCFDLPGLDGTIIPAEEVARVHLATLAFEFCQVTDVDAVLAALPVQPGTGS